ncbi:hypothetical protein IW261DRAFT_1498843 [Armillaria novae-zelandiae]|uniref:SHSP domain-containing protein n=1 Tax=Armillaria novae-zelandiae TaxID=153914 RepID=A0AA39NYU8_9AGAR|nr:hypothetical protein IW261DRAFT_1498843 [Armillaria novae-zelandiae]
MSTRFPMYLRRHWVADSRMPHLSSTTDIQDTHAFISPSTQPAMCGIAMNPSATSAVSSKHSLPASQQIQAVQGAKSSVLKPRMDLPEDEARNPVTATFEMHGLKKEDVQIEMHAGRLAISGESKSREGGEWLHCP